MADMVWIKLTPSDAPLPDAVHWVNLSRVAVMYRTRRSTVLHFSGDDIDTLLVEETPEEILRLLHAQRGPR